VVRDDHSASFTYLSARSPPIEEYGAVWARWQGRADVQPMYLASVYCPDAGAQQRNPNLLQDVSEQISVSLTHYCILPNLAQFVFWGIGMHMSPQRRTRLSPATCFIWLQLLDSGTLTRLVWSYLTSALLMASGLFPSTSAPDLGLPLGPPYLRTRG
jgi:hypothetical protein